MHISADRADANTDDFCDFKRQLFHASVARIITTLIPGMESPEVVRCSDNHFRRAIYGLGPYIADYQEQVLVLCVVGEWCAM